MTRKPEGALRRGWTTGACATAAVKAAYTALLTGEFPDPVSITLPKGEQPAFALARQALGDGLASAAIVKDAGDDPDVTHLATVAAAVRPGAPLASTAQSMPSGTEPPTPWPVTKVTVEFVSRWVTGIPA